MADGFLLIDKSSGWTSHDVVAKARSITGIRKIGHAGTLDPMATGLLVLGVGKATRLLRFVQELPKTYEAQALFGVATDSLDADGEELDRSPMPVSRERVEQAFASLSGDIQQVPPMVSAVKVKGERLHSIARRGEEVERQPRPVTVYEIAVVAFEEGDFPKVTFVTRCSSGTYVRVLADDAAVSLGGRAHLIALRRSKIGSLAVENAMSLLDLEAAVEEDGVEARLMTPSQGLSHLRSRDLSASELRLVENGAPLETYDADVDGLVRLMDGPSLLAVYRADGDKLVPEVVLS